MTELDPDEKVLLTMWLSKPTSLYNRRYNGERRSVEERLMINAKYVLPVLRYYSWANVTATVSLNSKLFAEFDDGKLHYEKGVPYLPQVAGKMSLKDVRLAMYGGRPVDQQRSLVYRFEDELAVGVETANEILSKDKGQLLIDMVCNDLCVPSVRLTLSRRIRGARHSPLHGIIVNHSFSQRRIILHELAHYLVFISSERRNHEREAGHGPRFVRTLLDLLRDYSGVCSKHIESVRVKYPRVMISNESVVDKLRQDRRLS